MFLTTPISFGTFAFSKNQSCKRRCARCLPRNRLEIGVPTFVSYRAGRCLTRLEVRLESSNVAVCDSTRCVAQTSLCAVFAAISAKTRQNLAVGSLCGLSCFRPSFRIVLADVCGPECRQRRCALCLLKLRSRLRETRNRIQQIDHSRTICSIYSSKRHVLSPTRNATLNNFTLSF